MNNKPLWVDSFKSGADILEYADVGNCPDEAVEVIVNLYGDVFCLQEDNNRLREALAGTSCVDEVELEDESLASLRKIDWR